MGEIVLNSIECSVHDGGVSKANSGLCLLVDDSSLVRKIARKILSGAGFEIDEAENGQVALEKCQNRMPNVVLLDWNMPVMDGLEFLKSLRRMDGGREPAVIFCTTEADVDHIQRALASGANEYLMKPFDQESLLAKLDMVYIRK
jgi:two-component system, chemotaxis family, chemotaxis protein CheY